MTTFYFENGHFCYIHWSDKGVVVWLSCIVSGASHIFPTLHIMEGLHIYHKMHQLHHYKEEPLFHYLPIGR